MCSSDLSHTTHTHVHTFLDNIVTEEAGEDRGGQCSVSQEDAGQHGQLGLLRLTEGFQEEQQLQQEVTRDRMMRSPGNN